MLTRHREEGIKNCRAFWEKALNASRFAHDTDQWNEGPMGNRSPETPGVGGKKTKRLTVNEIGPFLQALSGRQMMQRFEREYLPRSKDSAYFAQCLTDVDKAMMERVDAEQTESCAFRDGPGTMGISAVRWEYDTLESESGMIKMTPWPIWQMMWPRSCSQINLGDRPWHRLGFWMPASEVKDRWPERWEKVRHAVSAQPWASFSAEQSGGTSSRTPWSGGAGNKSLSELSFYDAHAGDFWVEYEEWRETETVYEVGIPTDPSKSYADAMAGAQPGQPDTMTSQTMTRAEKDQHRADHLAAFGEEVPSEMIVKRPRLKYRYAYQVANVILEDGMIPVGRYTLLFMTGFRFPLPQGTMWVGFVEKLIEAQKWCNILLSALIRNMQASPKGLLMYEQGMFASKKDAFAQWASPAGTIEVARGKLSSGADPFRTISATSSPYSAMVEPLLQMYREVLSRLSGFNPGAIGQLGADLRRISGEVVRSVQDAAMVSNAELFDSLRLYRREAGRLFLAFLSEFWGNRPQELVDIVGEEALFRMDEQTGQMVSTLPPPEMWKESAWKRISVEEVTPTGDKLESLWKSLGEQGVFQIVQTPQPDTGQPLFSSEDLAQMIAHIPEAMRQKMLMRIRAAMAQMQLAQKAAQQQPPDQAAA